MNKNQSVQGEKDGKWSYQNNQLILELDGKPVQLNVFAGQDWENEKKTLLFTGLNDKGFSVWGKRVK